jgi:transposase
MKKKPQLTKEIKEKIVELYLKGKSPGELATDFKCDRTSIYRWVSDFKKNREVLRSEKPGSGRPSKIDLKNGKKLLKIISRPASNYGFETDLWNSSRLQIVCRRELKIKLSHMAIWRFLIKFGQSFKKVQKQYYETDLKKQEEWKNGTLKQIKAAIKKYNAILYFEDESCIQLSPVMGKSWGPIGQKIVHKVTGNRGSLSAISAISNDGRLLFNVFDGGKRFNSDDIINFLGDMLKHHPRRHLVVVMDRATCHLSKKTKSFVESQKRLHVFYLPPRSPQLNPDEQVWAHLKNHELKSHQKTNLKDLKKLTEKKLKAFSRNKKKVKGVFKRCDNADLYF